MNSLWCLSVFTFPTKELKHRCCFWMGMCLVKHVNFPASLTWHSTISIPRWSGKVRIIQTGAKCHLSRCSGEVYCKSKIWINQGCVQGSFCRWLPAELWLWVSTDKFKAQPKIRAHAEGNSDVPHVYSNMIFVLPSTADDKFNGTLCLKRKQEWYGKRKEG